MPSGGLSCLVGEQSIRELLAVVGEDAIDFDGTGRMQGRKKAFGAGCGLVGLEGDVYPTCGPIDGDEQIASTGLIRHLRQIFDIDVQIARFVGLEGLGGFFEVSVLSGSPDHRHCFWE